MGNKIINRYPHDRSGELVDFEGGLAIKTRNTNPYNPGEFKYDPLSKEDILAIEVKKLILKMAEEISKVDSPVGALGKHKISYTSNGWNKEFYYNLKDVVIRINFLREYGISKIYHKIEDSKNNTITKSCEQSLKDLQEEGEKELYEKLEAGV